ncbi:MAG: segregation/condensation protein A [Candidatus Moranbacteria bacterium]|nr:segregation/condensation protein A [Candidatus Moranbacteria bacterium]
MAYHIQLPQFEGPLELLLALIEKQKLDVTRVSLAAITDQYLEYIATQKSISLQNLSWFLVIASRLILIKSKALLPLLTFDDEEEEAIEDLEYQLKEYKKFKEAALRLKGMLDAKRMMHAKEGYFSVQSLFYPPFGMMPSDLTTHFKRVLGEIPVLEKLEEKMVEEVVTLEEKIVSLQAMLQRKAETSFTDIVAHAKNKVDVIVSFLAMLELVKQRMIQVEQGELFSEIRLKQNERKEKSAA